MEDKEISLNPPPHPLIKLPQISMPSKSSFFNQISKSNEGNLSVDTNKANPRQLPKNATASDYQIEKVISHRLNKSKDQKIFLVKYKNKSYHELRWITEADFGNQIEIMNDYLKTAQENPTEPFFNKNYLIPEKVFSVKKTKLQKQYLVKWTDLEYYESTWENEYFIRSLNENLIKEFEERVKTTSKSSSIISNFQPILEFHSSKNGYQLDSYQIDILNFLMNSWCFSQNSLIPDIEEADVRPGIVIFLERIISQGKESFLIVTDESLIEKWESDLKEWTNISFLTFLGTKENLDILKKYEFSKHGSSDEFIYPIYITTIQNLMSYHKIFSQTTWEGIILDNSQKDSVIFDKTSLNHIVSKLKMKYRIFMTPPLEDVDPHSIWPWLNFVDPNNFHLESRFTKSFCKDGKIEVRKLNNNTSFQYFDESKNSDFELTEIFVKCPLTDIQEEAIKEIYEPFTKDSSENLIKDGFNMRKIGNSTRKILGHPFEIKDIANKLQQEKKKSFSSANYSIYESEFFLKSSGKLFILDTLLKKFKSEFKNVVIICQTMESIEILEKFMLAKFYSYEKVDSLRRGRSRYEAVMQFNDESKRIFAFILDAKTGYFTMKADYVVIYESDWNSRNDVFIANKILSIKSKKEVYRLVTEKSYEMAFVNNFQPDPNSTQEIVKLVQFGYNEMLSEKSAELNEKLLQFMNSEKQDPNYLLHNYTAFNKYSSIKEMSDSIPIEKWIQLDKKNSEKNDESSEKVDVEKNNLSPSKDGLKSSENEEEDDDEDDNNELSVEEEEFNEYEYNETELRGDLAGWTPKMIFHLFNLMLKYGISSWDDFAKSIPMQSDEIRKVGLIIIQQLLLNTENIKNYVILQKFLDRWIQFYSAGQNTSENKDDTKLFDEDFIKNHEKEIQKITSPRVDWKLDRLEFLYIVDVSFHAREKSHGDKTIPSFRPSTFENDMKIIEIVKKKGYPLKKLTTTLKNMKMTLKKANSRVVNLIEELKEIFLDYCQTFELDNELTTEKLIDSLKMLNTKEKKKVFQAIQLVGIDNLDSVFEASKLKKDRKKVFMKYMDQFKKFAHFVIRNKKVPFDFFGAHYSLKTLTEGILSIAILKYLRENVDVTIFPDRDRPLFQYIKENGFKNIKKEEIFTNRFSEPIEQSLIEFLHLYFSSKKKIIFNNFFKEIESPVTSPVKQEPSHLPSISPSQSSTVNNKDDDVESKLNQLSKYIDFNLPDGTSFSNDEISSMLPIKVNENTIITNLGKVVYDRPNFHNERYLYLSGYTVEKYFTSIHDPSKKEWYILHIKDTGGDFPLFTIESKEEPSIYFEGNSPSNPSIELLKKINAVRNRPKSQVKQPTISGPEFFGFAAPKVKKIMERLPNADKCPKFKGLTNSLPSQSYEFKKVKTEDQISDKRELRTRKNRVVVIDDDQTTSEYNSDFEQELDDDDEDDDDEVEDEENEEEEEDNNEDYENEENDNYDTDDGKEFKKTKNNNNNNQRRNKIQSKSKLKLKLKSNLSVRKKNKKKSKQSDDDDADYGENYETDESEYNDDDDDDDDKSLVQRFKARYLKGKVRTNRLEKRYNLRKRVNRKNYNEYEEEEEDYDENENENNNYDDEEEDNDNNNNNYDNEEEDQIVVYKVKNKGKNKKQIRKIHKKNNKRFIKTKNVYIKNNDDYDDYASSTNYEYNSNTSNASSEDEKETKSKYSPNKMLKGEFNKSKDKKTKTGVTHFSDSSDENNYYDFACNNIPDMFSEEKITLGSKSNKNNVLNSGVVFYFDKLTKKPEKDLIVNYFSSDPNMLCVDRDFLAEFVSVNPQYSHLFSNK